MLAEEWKDVQGWEGRYQVSNLGRVRSLPMVYRSSLGNAVHKPGRIRKSTKDTHGYPQVFLCEKQAGRKETRLVHRLVVAAFLPNPESLQEVNHKDGNKTNNTVENLEWCTRLHNVDHANTLPTHRTGTRTSHSKLNWDTVNWVRAVHTPYDKMFGTRSLARLLGVLENSVAAIVSEDNWRYPWTTKPRQRTFYARRRLNPRAPQRSE